MVYIILGDIHSNLQALEACLGDLPKDKSFSAICTGDIVGYGANPEECVRLIKSLGARSVIGNHEAGVVDKTDISNFNEYAQEAVLWTKEHVDARTYDYFNTLPYVIEEEFFTVAHGTLHSPAEFIYMTKDVDAIQTFEILKNKICFIGHTHRPLAFILKNSEISRSFEKKITLEDSCKYIINVGSIGQPRDRDNRACYCIYDAEKKTLEFKRVEYDVLLAREHIINAGLPKVLGDRLLYGE